jgi:hypothetical protein
VQRRAEERVSHKYGVVTMMLPMTRMRVNILMLMMMMMMMTSVVANYIACHSV